METNEYYEFMNGLKVPRSQYRTRGIFLNECGHLLPPHIKPILENEIITVRQDAEFPVPAFYIIGIKEPVASIADVPEDTAALLGLLTHIIRKGMKEVLGVQRVNIYLEEKLKNPHYHSWLLPMWQEVLDRNHIEPRIWESNIMTYIRLFRFEEEGDRILKYNELLREYLHTNYLSSPSVLSKYNFV